MRISKGHTRCFPALRRCRRYAVVCARRKPLSLIHIYRRIQQRKDHPKGIWTKAVAGARNLCAMAMPMIQMMMARELRGFVPDAELNPIVQENLDLFFRRHVDRERKCVFERVLDVYKRQA